MTRDQSHLKSTCHIMLKQFQHQTSYNVLSFINLNSLSQNKAWKSNQYLLCIYCYCLLHIWSCSEETPLEHWTRLICSSRVEIWRKSSRLHCRMRGMLSGWWPVQRWLVHVSLETSTKESGDTFKRINTFLRVILIKINHRWLN